MKKLILLDSCILIEHFKGTRIEVLPLLWDKNDVQLCVCETVISEFLFHFIALQYGKAPLTAKSDREIGNIITRKNPLPLLERFLCLPALATTPETAIYYMQHYNLLPNDALILAVASGHTIARLATYDPDLIVASNAEGVALINNAEDALTTLNT